MTDDSPTHHSGVLFPILRSNGGTFDDVSFSAGWNLGVLDQRLTTAHNMRMFLYPQILQTDLFEQIDLLAMRLGFSVEREDHPTVDTLSIYNFIPDLSTIPEDS